MRNRKAFTFLEVCISLAICYLVIGLAVSSIRIFAAIDEQSILRQNQLGLIQLRRTMALGRRFKVNSTHVCFNLYDSTTCVGQKGRRLLSEPGTVIYLIECDEIVFYWNEGWIMLRYWSGNQSYEVKLIYA